MTISATFATTTFLGEPWVRSARPRPALEFQHVLDVCSALAYSSGGPVAIISGCDWLVDELRDRMAETGILGHFVSPSAPRIHDALDEPESLCPLAIWAANDEPELYRSMVRSVAPGGRICHVAVGPASRYLRKPPSVNGRPQLLEDGTACSWLRSSGAAIVARYGFRGPISLFWGALAGALDRIGRDDASDYAHRRMRSSFVESGALVGWSTLTLTIARRPSEAGAMR